jgi:hypothetical protein
MKKIVALFAFVALASCGSGVSTEVNSDSTVVDSTKIDSAVVVDSTKIDSAVVVDSAKAEKAVEVK